MKLGIFDSGLGGLLISKAIRDHLPGIDMLYVGDTLHLPYGNRSDEAIYMYTKRAMEYMFEQDCQLIVIACNTASAAALRKLQQQWLPKHWTDRNIIGVVVPTLEEAIEHGHKKLGVIGTNYIISSGIYEEELTKLSPEISIIQKPTPLLVPLIEYEGEVWVGDILNHYLEDLIAAQIECLLLGCTHYPFLKPQMEEVLGPNITVLAQDHIIPHKLANYLDRHPEHSDKIAKAGASEFHVSDLTDNYQATAEKIYEEHIKIKKVEF